MYPRGQIAKIHLYFNTPKNLAPETNHPIDFAKFNETFTEDNNMLVLSYIYPYNSHDTLYVQYGMLFVTHIDRRALKEIDLRYFLR